MSRSGASIKSTRFFRVAGITLLATFFISQFLFADGTGDEKVLRLFFPGKENRTLLRCTWRTPQGEQLTFDFPSAPLLVCGPRSDITCQMFIDGQTVKINSLAEKKFSINSEPHEFSPPAKAVRFNAPESGETSLELAGIHEGKRITFSLACQIARRPSWSSGKFTNLSVDGELHGRYVNPKRSRTVKVRTHEAAYQPPEYFVRITELNHDLLISPHLRVGDLIVPSSKTGRPHSKNAPANYRFLKNVETLFAVLDCSGIPMRSIGVLSIYRSPNYNRSIGSGSFSRHLYMDAIDMIIDGNNDGKCDDLDGDGRLTRDDALKIVDAIEAAQKAGKLSAGGIGLYSFPTSHPKGLTFHIDFRGHRATWAYQYSSRGTAQFSWKSKYFAEQDARERAALKRR